MSVAYVAYNPLDPSSRADIEADEPQRVHARPDGALYLDLRGLWLDPLPDIDEARIAELSRIVRGLIFAAVEVQSPTREEIHTLIGSTPSLRILADMGEGGLRNLESEWHKIYIGWHAILGQLKVKQRAVEGKGFWGHGK